MQAVAVIGKLPRDGRVAGQHQPTKGIHHRLERKPRIGLGGLEHPQQRRAKLRCGLHLEAIIRADKQIVDGGAVCHLLTAMPAHVADALGIDLAAPADLGIDQLAGHHVRPG